MESNRSSSESPGDPPPNRRSIWESRILRAGALSGALAAIVGLAASVFGVFGGDDPQQSPERSAVIEPAAVIKNVEVGGLAGIATAFRRTPTARTCKRLPKGALRVSRPPRSPLPPTEGLAAGRTILAQVDTVPEAEESPEPDQPAGSTEPTEPTDPTERKESTADDGGGDTPSEGDSDPSTDGGDSTPKGDPDENEAGGSDGGQTTPSQTGGETELNRPGVENEVTLPNGVDMVPTILPADGAPPGAEALQVTPAAFSTEEEQAALAEVALVESASGGAPQALGRLIDLSVRLRGLEDECVQLAWSLYDARVADVVPERWLQFRTGLRFVAGKADTSASEQFWVPLPRRGGRFYVRLALFREDGTRLTTGRSEPFNQPKSDPSGFVRRAGYAAATASKRLPASVQMIWSRPGPTPMHTTGTPTNSEM